MQAWMLTEPGKPLEAFEQERPEPAGSEVVVEVTHCGVCHSDLYYCAGEYPIGGGKVLTLAQRGVALPCAPGHEIAGTVVEFGPDAIGVAVGNRCVVYPWIGCGICMYCRRGDDNLCVAPTSIGIVRHGGFGRYVVVPDAKYLIDPGTVDLAQAATYACSGITVYSAISRILPIAPDAPVALIGAGGLGLLAIGMLKALNHENIVSIDIDSAKLAAAQAAGATRTFDGAGPNVAANVIDAIGPVAAVIDFVCSDRTAETGIAMLAKRGSYVAVGVEGGTLNLGLPGVTGRALSIHGSLTGSRADLAAVLALAQQGKLQATPISTFAHSSVNATLQALSRGEITGRAVLVRDLEAASPQAQAPA